MWLGWRKSSAVVAHVVLGQTFWALRHPVMGWQREPCAGWQDGLRQAAVALGDKSPHRLPTQVWLSGAVCPALWLIPPEGLKAGEEWRAWVCAAVASQGSSQAPMSQTVVWVASDRVGPTIAAVILADWIKEMETTLGHRSLAAVRPVWCSALELRATVPRSGSELWSVFDGDSLCSFQVDPSGVNGATTLLGMASIEQAKAIHLRRRVASTFAASSLRRLDIDRVASGLAPLNEAWAEVPE